MQAWFEKLAPDFVATYRRFPFPIVLAFVGAVILLLGINGIWVFEAEPWGRASFGLFTGAAFGVGGVLFAESRPAQPRPGLVLKYLLPILVAASFQITDTAWFIPFGMPIVAVLWTSIAAFTHIGKGEERETQQNRFWWLNHEALATAAIAGAAFAIILLGVLAIERSLALLFGIQIGAAFYRWLLPFTGTFLVPVYWLSTIPKLGDFDATALSHPDFTSRAVGFLGQFVLAPLLLAYGLILLAYTVQIVVTGTLPEGVLGWMVLGFVSTGAATWLVLHPPFMRERLLVKWFRRGWFWLTLIPLALFAYAVWVRVDAYGLTPERVMLIGGGLWAALLAAIFLAGRGDIRLIPGLAATIIIALSIGPWNVDNAPREEQAARLSAAMAAAGVTSPNAAPTWSSAQVDQARSAINYLISDNGRRQLERVMAAHGLPLTATAPYYDVATLYGMLQLPEIESGAPVFQTVNRDLTLPVDVAATPYMIGPVSLYQSSPSRTGNVVLDLEGTGIRVADDAPDFVTYTSVDLTDWVARQTGQTLTEATIDIVHNGVTYRLIIQGGSIQDDPATGRYLSYVDGVLFRSAPEPGKPPVTPTP